MNGCNFGDELTGELDTKMTAEVMKLITKLNANGQTFIIVTHNLKSPRSVSASSS